MNRDLESGKKEIGKWFEWLTGGLNKQTQAVKNLNELSKLVPIGMVDNTAAYIRIISTLETEKDIIVSYNMSGNGRSVRTASIDAYEKVVADNIEIMARAYKKI